MPSPKQHVAEDGSITYKVRYQVKVLTDDDKVKWASRSITFRGDTAAEDADDFAAKLTERGVDAALAYQRRKEDAGLRRSVPLFRDWVESYIATRTGVTDGTRHGYERIYALMLDDRLGDKYIDLIDHADIAGTINYLATKGGRTGKGYSDKSVRNAFGLLSGAMGHAHLDGKIPTNPTARIKLPRATSHQRAEMVLLDESEFAEIVYANREHYQPLVLTLGGTGIRWGEAEALTVGDVNIDAATFRINKAAKWDTSKAQREVGPTKTRHSDRTVTLPAAVVESLRPLVKGRKKSERLFTAPRGGPLRHKSFWEDSWRKAIVKLDLDPQPRIHDLRHTHASWLIAQGVPLPVIQRRLGHHSITVTVDTYGHLAPDIQRAAADAANLSLTSFTLPALD